MMTHDIITALHKVRQIQPLVINMTNDVVTNYCANALLAVGASPIMANSRHEMAELISMAGALVVNIGTLNETRVNQMHYAIECANHAGIPVVLDPVGCGATKYRTQVSQTFCTLAENLIIRANASEIKALSGMKGNTKGVDSTAESTDVIDAGYQLLRPGVSGIVISGATDVIISPTQQVHLYNGSTLMPYVTGTGCSLSAMVGAFAAVGETSGFAATAIWGIAGEITSHKAQGPGSFAALMLDNVYQLDNNQISNTFRGDVIANNSAMNLV
ncbi:MULTISPECIES: hydroxyethylthiazole kinase [Vibrio]|uniref:Hydroxyethylthiazole kinase n=2 Tax=Vibrio TaxID=662 RepID=A0A7X4LN16_9VIBR|nr:MULTISPECIES: hydroxyethylthiazole kinase [Vibrio]MBF9000890.1 hydroxyethylthiazole kinase [Vibrio nitrifigilis]MZI94997.1 hydroxyethylthiazole kinase [Vibrio eleionomae]